MAVLKRDPATRLLEGKQTVDGTLILDGRYLRFIAADLSAQAHHADLHVPDIKRLRADWTVLTLSRDVLTVEMRNSEVFHFKLGDRTLRKDWATEIEYAAADTPRG